MRNKVIGLVVVLTAACGGEEAPSCQQAVTHFYDAGCVLFDRQTNQPFTVNEVVTQCQGLLAAAPDQCLDELADLRSCWGGVRSPAASNADCDCSPEQDAILTCE